MSKFPRKQIANSFDNGLLVPWIVTGRVDLQNKRLFSAALASEMALADNLAAARVERAAVVEMNEAIDRPSMRPMLDLFAAIDREQSL